MAIWDDLKKYGNVAAEKAEEFGKVAAEKAEEFGKVAANKTEELRKIGKIKLEIHQLEKDLEKCFSILGSYVYDSTEKENVSNFSGNDKFFNLIEEAKNLKQNILNKKSSIDDIKK